MKKLITLTGAIIALGSVVGILFALDSRYAHTDYVIQIEYRLDQKIIQDRAAALQERLWRLEDRYLDKAKNMEEYKRLQFELENLKIKMQRGGKL